MVVAVVVVMAVAVVVRETDSSHIYGSNFGDPEDMTPDSNRFLGPTLLAIYLLISSIVLTNLLIAMVSTTVIERGWLLEGRRRRRRRRRRRGVSVCERGRGTERGREREREAEAGKER